jgi:hypothetical protein
MVLERNIGYGSNVQTHFFGLQYRHVGTDNPKFFQPPDPSPAWRGCQTDALGQGLAGQSAVTLQLTQNPIVYLVHLKYP